MEHQPVRKLCPYVQSQLPDVNIEFIVGNNDLDFYKFLQQNGGLPDMSPAAAASRRTMRHR